MAIQSDPPASFHSSRDVAELNHLLNHPRIRPHMGGEGYLDGTPLMGAFYTSEHGGMLFHESEPGLWEGHWLFLAPNPKKLALGILAQFMLDEQPKLLWGRVPVGNRAARLFTRSMGFTSLGLRECPFLAEIFVWGQSPCRSLVKSSVA